MHTQTRKNQALAIFITFCLSIYRNFSLKAGLFQTRLRAYHPMFYGGISYSKINSGSDFNEHSNIYKDLIAHNMTDPPKFKSENYQLERIHSYHKIKENLGLLSSLEGTSYQENFSRKLLSDFGVENNERGLIALIKTSNFDAVKNYVEDFDDDKDFFACDALGNNILHLCVIYGREDIFALLFPRYSSLAYLQNNEDETVLHLVVRINNSMFLEKILSLIDKEKQKLLILKENKFSLTPLSLAAASGYITMVFSLLSFYRSTTYYIELKPSIHSALEISKVAWHDVNQQSSQIKNITLAGGYNISINSSQPFSSNNIKKRSDEMPVDEDVFLKRKDYAATIKLLSETLGLDTKQPIQEQQFSRKRKLF